jgi:soluble lytic murein transglycosylase-like protein
MHTFPTVERTPQAKARRRRLARRQAQRRLSRVALAASVTMALAVALTPEPTLVPDAPAPFAAGARDTASASLQRWNRIYRFSTRYRVSPDLARLVYDIARQEGIDPELAFRLVQVESRFNPRVASPAGAVGLTQLMPATARYLQPGVTREQLLDPATNLRIGFRYLRTLIREQRGDLKLALLVYNRGPVAVAQDLARGVDPTNGYERVVMRGLRGRGVLD